MTAVKTTSEIRVELVRALAQDSYVAHAARVSTIGAAAGNGLSQPVAPLVRALMRDQHGSPFEHGSFTFRVTAPINVMTEHLRHRAGWSYNGESGRYKTMTPNFYVPPRIRPITQVGKPMDYDMQPGSPEQYRHVVMALTRCAQAQWDEYEGMLKAGIAREVARSVLGTNLMVTYYTTCNPRSLMAFLALRTSDAGTSKPLWEIEQVARQYEEALALKMPITHSAFEDNGRVAP